jgi:transposase-like protein
MNNLAAASAFQQPAPSRKGRPPLLSPEKRREMASRFRAGETVADLAPAYGVSKATAYAVRAAAMLGE